MIQIYHNPRCSKSRQGLAIVEASGQTFEVIKYLDNPPSTTEMEGLLTKLNMAPEALIRKGEAIWKEQFKGKDLDHSALVDALCTHPKLIERPIVVNGDKAVVGRPPEAINDVL
ncbi:arsenate reductase (glutaredoxin) [Sediminicola luteus]|uniref:Arsenate reductase (Glutaredoxin) n=1 Tax=Sediminicola luteus TaxID=319238 RepID=A0A2A4G799_9FLAO|nr:arsenate reductase (glutaredoxin) [Sediminicola luteus]PCE63866.1 arsenate reductase (glutaredoxin) [Sediminicola luteus]